MCYLKNAVIRQQRKETNLNLKNKNKKLPTKILCFYLPQQEKSDILTFQNTQCFSWREEKKAS